MKFFAALLSLALFVAPALTQSDWWRSLEIGLFPTGKLNAITDVDGVSVGQVTLIEGDDCRTGVTSIIPHPGNLFKEKVPCAIYVANGFGKLAGSTQVDELGLLETPIILTNTLSVPVAASAVIKYMIQLPGNQDVRSVNPLVGETNDGFLNNIRAGYVTESHVLQVLKDAGPVVQEGSVGAGTGTRCFGFKGGIGTSSRLLPEGLGHYKVGVLVQTNFGGILRINGAPIGEALGAYYLKEQLEAIHDGSCMIVVATDAPLDARQLKRLAKRSLHGLVRSGGVSTHGSGDYVVAFSTATQVRYQHESDLSTHAPQLLRDEYLSPLFVAAAEAVEEAIYHSLFASSDMTGFRGTVPGLPHEKVRALLQKHQLYQLRN